ncbi:AFG1-like ATPase [Suhomyces tanzawaensis NRRL Y-17324]|uniref:AFG1-like ATPase n=1 Tax=Suhomyces tanzawaensis NRRL Y-17324 TaxID=984487 RepID=A0A1E4SER5_9ASCO|nr:AFG1-like ATPase [Suhomyces tanzawaensis NRRL Y-17324]ODV78011.1 AFG1-like ATPase [Suhomyces tanzawaensis NRRL Y-17324]
MTPLEAYNSRVASGRLRDDPYQRRIIGNLLSLHEKLVQYTPPSVRVPSIEELVPKTGISLLFQSLFRPKTETVAEPESTPQGIYLYGDVGCGKTMLMDLFYATIPLHLPKKRVHFHQFMQHLHKRSHQLKMEHNHYDLDVIPFLAAEIAQDSTILCFDEFQVTDVADAMLLRRLLTMLLSPEYGVILFATSNRAPDDLYLNGIQRVSFIPCIQQIKRQTRVIYLNSPTDYRKIPKPMSNVYHYPKPGVKWTSKTNQTKCRDHVEAWFGYFNAANPLENVLTDHTLQVWGRQLKVPRCAPPYVAQFNFEELCGSPLAAGDYLTLANSFQSFIITDIPYLSIEVRDKVRRFITFLDAVYDDHGRLAVTAAALFNDLFVEPEDLQRGNYQLYKRQQDKGSVETFEDDELVVKHGFDKLVAKKASMFANDEEKFAFARALSRLSQMSTTDWIDTVRPVHEDVAPAGARQ